MKINTHPKHIDLNKVSNKSTYNQTMQRFESILENKMGINNRQKPPVKINSSDISGNVTTKSFDAANKIDKYFKNTPLDGLGKSFEEAEDKYGVNAFFLASIAAHESAYGSSKIARDKNNLFGFQAYDGSPYKSARSFNSFQDGIDKVAKYLSEEYLNENGRYYMGKSIKDINKNYATDKRWHEGISKIIQEMSK